MGTDMLRQVLAPLGLLTALGLAIALCVLVGGGAGLALGRWLGFPTAGALVGLALGVGGAGLSAFRMVGRYLPVEPAGKGSGT